MITRASYTFRRPPAVIVTPLGPRLILSTSVDVKTEVFFSALTVLASASHSRRNPSGATNCHPLLLKAASFSQYAAGTVENVVR